MRNVLVGLGLLAAGVACGSTSGQKVPVVRLESASSSFTYFSGLSAPERVVIRDQASWASMWAAMSLGGPVPALPDVDFTNEMLVVAALGERPTEGYSIFIDHAVAVDGSVEVTVRSVAPGQTCIVFNDFTQPVDIARLPRYEGPITFRETSEIHSC
jgi:hypothetical protein